MPMTEADFKKHLDAAESSPKQIAAAVSGLPENVLRYKPSPEKWCILEVLGHLADADNIGIEVVGDIARAEETPPGTFVALGQFAEGQLGRR